MVNVTKSGMSRLRSTCCFALLDPRKGNKRNRCFEIWWNSWLVSSLSLTIPVDRTGVHQNDQKLLCNMLMMWDILFLDISILKYLFSQSPRAHLHVVGMLRFMPDINQLILPTPFLFFSCVCFCLFGPFNFVLFLNSPDNSPFSHSVLPVLSLSYWSFQLYISLWKSPSAQIWSLVVD